MHLQKTIYRYNRYNYNRYYQLSVEQNNTTVGLCWIILVSFVKGVARQDNKHRGRWWLIFLSERDVNLTKSLDFVIY